MLEEGTSFERIQTLAERRDDDICDLGSIGPKDEAAKMQKVQEGCQEYGQLYLNYTLTFEDTPVATTHKIDHISPPLDDLDAEHLLIQPLPGQHRLTALPQLIG